MHVHLWSVWARAQKSALKRQLITVVVLRPYYAGVFNSNSYVWKVPQIVILWGILNNVECCKMLSSETKHIVFLSTLSLVNSRDEHEPPLWRFGPLCLLPQQVFSRLVPHLLWLVPTWGQCPGFRALSLNGCLPEGVVHQTIGVVNKPGQTTKQMVHGHL